MIDNAASVGAQIRMRLPNLTPLEGKVVKDILERKDITEKTALSDIAKFSDVSEAMVVKVAKKLGFSGFREFRQGLFEYFHSESAALYSEILPDDTAPAILRKVFQTTMQALEETYAIFDIGAFEMAANYLYKGKQRDFYGLGGSAQIARDVSHKFLRIGLRTSVFDDVHMMLMSAALHGPDDVVIAFSHSGETSAVVDAVELSRNNGARIIAVTNYSDSTLAKASDVVLCSTAENSPLLGENATARIAQLNLLDALFVTVAQKDRETSHANLNLTMNAVKGKRRGRD